MELIRLFSLAANFASAFAHSLCLCLCCLSLHGVFSIILGERRVFI